MKTINKSTILLLLLIVVFQAHHLTAQNKSFAYENPQMFFSIGVSVPTLKSGTELMRASDLRDNNLSYYQNALGERKDVGSYSNLTGWNLSIGYYKPLKKVKRLLLGAEFDLSLNGSEPKAGSDEAYYFNYITLGVGAKYYPIEKKNLFAKLNFGGTNVMTKNRFIDDTNQQQIFHQFGVGGHLTSGIGYSLPVGKNKSNHIELDLNYKLMTARVEVNNIGDDNWRFNAFEAKLGFIF